eukprot:56307-Eustigmatos_ZCMA.PRE.1
MNWPRRNGECQLRLREAYIMTLLMNRNKCKAQTSANILIRLILIPAWLPSRARASEVIFPLTAPSNEPGADEENCVCLMTVRSTLPSDASTVTCLSSVDDGYIQYVPPRYASPLYMVGLELALLCLCAAPEACLVASHLKSDFPPRRYARKDVACSTERARIPQSPSMLDGPMHHKDLCHVCVCMYVCELSGVDEGFRFEKLSIGGYTFKVKNECVIDGDEQMGSRM